MIFNIDKLFKRKVFWISLFIIICQVLTTVFVYYELKSTEDNDIRQFIDEKSESILLEYNIILENMNHIISRNEAIFQNNGKLLSQTDFENYIRQDDIPVIQNIRFQRWYPYITHPERESFEDYCRLNVKSDFEIRNIEQIFPFFITSIAENASQYIPLMLSTPEFTVGPLGLDLLNISSLGIKDDVLLSLNLTSTTPGRRTRLFELDSFINHGIQIYSPVYDFNTTEKNFSSLIGIQYSLIVPNNIFIDIITNNKIGRNNLDFFMFDMSDSVPDSISLIYREVIYENIEGRQSINLVNKLTNIYTSSIFIGNREYFIGFRYKDNYLNDERTFFPEGMLIMMIILFVSLDIISLIVYISYNNSIEFEKERSQLNIFKNINHRMRNPLNSIQGLNEILICQYAEKLGIMSTDVPNIVTQLDSVDKTQNVTFDTDTLINEYMKLTIDSNYLAIILSNIISEGNLITNLSHPSEILNNMMSIDVIVTHINNITQIIRDESNHINFECDIFDPEYMVYTDLKIISVILYNFIDNAFKYIDYGHVTLKVEKEDDDIIFSVIDTGNGISDDIAKNIFKYQKTNTNIGTYYASQLSKTINGNVGFSTSKDGSVFWLKIKSQNEDIDESIV